MARTKLTKRARDEKQQEAVRRQQIQAASGRDMRTEKSTKRHGNFNGRDAKVKPLLLQPFQKQNK